MFEAKIEAKSKALRPRPKFWPRGHFGLEDLTSWHVVSLVTGMEFNLGTATTS